MPLERNVIYCECGSPEHQFIFTYDPEDDSFPFTLSPHLTTYHNVFMRLWYALKYVFGYKSKFGAFDEVIVSKEDATKLRNVLNEYINDKSSIDIMMDDLRAD